MNSPSICRFGSDRNRKPRVWAHPNPFVALSYDCWRLSELTLEVLYKMHGVSWRNSRQQLSFIVHFIRSVCTQRPLNVRASSVEGARNIRSHECARIVRWIVHLIMFARHRDARSARRLTFNKRPKLSFFPVAKQRESFALIKRLNRDVLTWIHA